MPKKAKSTAKSAKKAKKSSKSDAQSVASAAPSEPTTPSAAASPAPSAAGAAASGSGAGAGGRRPSATLEFNAGQLFERYDGDRRGYLDQSAFARLCRDMGLHAAGPPGGASPHGDPSRPSPRTSFDAGRLFQRYTLGNSGRLDKAQFDRFAQDYLVGHGGPSAGYSRPPYWGGADQLAPGYYPYQAPYQHEYTPPWRTPAPAYPPSPDKEFEAGRLFERYDKNQSGAIERGEFERMVTDLRHSGGRAAAPPVPPLAPRAPHVAARAAWESPYGAIGMYGGHLSTMDAFRARMSDMTALTASLMVKREQMMQQLAKVQLHREHVKAARRGIERETIADAEEILHRLRSKEAFKLSLLQHDLDELRNDIAAIDRFHASFSAYQPRPTAGAMYSDVDAQTAMEFLSRYPELCGEADRLASKSVKMTVDVAVDDFERETAERLHALQQFQAFKAMLEDRESVIAALDAEAEQARTDVQALQGKAKVEMEQMWKFSDTVVQKLESFRMQCEYCGTHLLDSTVNTDCQVAAAASAEGASSEGGAARHKWVKVAASQDSLLSWFA